jgi:predicted RND superfamily exporter protein
MDSSKQFMRISYNMADVGTDSLHRVLATLRLGVDSIMEGRDEKVFFTGNSLMFLRGNQYLVRSLAGSILMAVLLIALMMGLTYRSWKAVLFALLPNSLPLLFTAGVMGWMGVSIKPSTVLIFSIVLGIAVDDCIHYLARYYQEIKRHNRSTMEHLRVCTLETGGSMIYTSIILFFGFVVFAFSDFGGTQALGLMSAVTLLLAMVANLVLLPTLILWMDRWKRPGSAVQP